VGRSTIELFSRISARLGEQQLDRAVVWVAIDDGGAPVVFVRVEGKWFPEEFTLNWDGEMEL